MDQITIEWEGPFALEEVQEMNKKTDRGLYQIYGHHIIFGPNSLLYIGKAEKYTFAKRFVGHWNDWIWYDDKQGRKVSIYIARMPLARVPSEVLRDVEAVQIYWHSPPYNSEFIQSVGEKRKRRLDRNPLQIVNEGKHHRLVKILSTEDLPWY